MRFFIFILLILFFNKVFANIIYDKNGFLITEIELNTFIKLHEENNGVKFSNKDAIKLIVLQKKTISQLQINQPEFFKVLDEKILYEFGSEAYNNEIVRDYLRYFKVRNEFIFDYFQNSLRIDELRSVLKSFSDFKIPLSQNNCQTINQISDLRDNNSFVKNLYDQFKNNNNISEININGEKYNICLDKKSYQIIEIELTKYIELKTEDKFKRFIYGK